MSIAKGQFIKGLLKIWKVDDKDQCVNSDVIVALSYAVKKDSLTDGTRETLKTAIEYVKRFPSALLVFANSSHCFLGSEKTEERFKLEMTYQAEIPRSSVISCGPIINTVTEAEAICRTLQRLEKQPKNILIITGTMHSRGARYIWSKMLKKYFPGAKLSVAVIPFEYEYQNDHPLVFQRGPIRWIFANIGRQLAL